jgi:hypothetical protein
VRVTAACLLLLASGFVVASCATFLDDSFEISPDAGATGSDGGTVSDGATTDVVGDVGGDSEADADPDQKWNPDSGTLPPVCTPLVYGPQTCDAYPDAAAATFASNNCVVSQTICTIEPNGSSTYNTCEEAVPAPCNCKETYDCACVTVFLQGRTCQMWDGMPVLTEGE